MTNRLVPRVVEPSPSPWLARLDEYDPIDAIRAFRRLQRRVHEVGFDGVAQERLRREAGWGGALVEQRGEFEDLFGRAGSRGAPRNHITRQGLRRRAPASVER